MKTDGSISHLLHCVQLADIFVVDGYLVVYTINELTLFGLELHVLSRDQLLLESSFLHRKRVA